MTQKEKYRQFCSQREELPIFVQDWYLDAVCAEGQWDVALSEREGEIVACLPYFMKRKAFFRYIAMPVFTKMMGPFLIPEMRALKLEHIILEELLDQLPGLDSFRQQFHYTTTNWLPFYWAGFRQSTRYTYLLGLPDMDEVFAGFNRNIRRNIRKAEQELKVVHDLPLEVFFKLNKMSFARQGKAIPYSFEELRRHDEALATHKSRQLFFAVDEKGKLHSAAYLIWDGRAAYYHLSGDDPNFRQSGSGILLVWETIKFTKNQLGLGTFDFEGSMIKNIEQIRRQFGARQQPYFDIWKYNSGLFQLLEYLKNA